MAREKALDFAAIHGVDRPKAVLAALFYDIARVRAFEKGRILRPDTSSGRVTGVRHRRPGGARCRAMAPYLQQ
ncbi:MAG: hypothetical protein QF579_02650 [Dehalococcoidia bacterium]|nr:hypothetical protein [Dehalococcoidia bacterium]